jgi:vitamin K-dependent gamma-carboxylase-like protein
VSGIPKNRSVEHSAYAKVVEIFGADLRSLATFRIVLALLALSDLANRATDLSAHYTDAGIMPRTVLVEQVLSPWAFSLHLMNGGSLFQALLFGVAALAAFGMLVGYRTRLMTFVVWALLLSIQLRNPLLNGSESPMLRMLFFWGMLLPLGAYWSVDRARSALPRPSPGFLSLATFGLFMQIAFVYWFTAALKAGPEWRSDYTALYYALSLDQLATPIGHLLLDFPSLLQALTLGTVVLEALGPLLLFCPFFTGPVRTGAALAFMSFHLGIWLTMDIGIFPWISAFCMVCFFPTWFWERASTLRSVLLRRVELARRLQLATVRLGNALIAFSKAVVSFLMEARQLLFAGPVPPLAAGARGASETRHDEALSEEPAELRSSLAANLLAFFFIFYILCWNLTTATSFTLPERTVPLGPFLGLDQYWGMFAPSPSNEDGWYVIPGELRDGQKVDLMPITRDDYSMHPISYEKPQDIPATYKNEHWRKYLENIYNQDHAGQRLYFGQYICRQWNSHHTGADTLETFRIIYMLELTLPDYRQSKPEKVDLWNHTC